MALDVGTLVARVVVDTSGVHAGLAQARAQLNLLGSSSNSAGSALDRVGSRGAAMGDRVKAGARVGVLALGGVATAAVAGAAAMAGYGLKSAAELEQTKVAFTSLLGSAKLAQDQLTQLQQFAAATPFSQQDVLNMAQQYYAFADSVGLSKTAVKSYLTAIGDVGAVTGASAQNIQNAAMAIGQIGSSGKVTLDNLNQISEAFPGFNAAAAIARAQGRPTADVLQDISSGSLSASDGVQALIKGMQSFPGAAGAMAKQSETLSGLWSTFTDTAKLSLVNAFEPMIPAVKSTLAQLTPVIGDALNGVAPTIVHFAQQLMPLLKPLIEGLSVLMDSVLSAVGPALGALGPIIKPLASAISALFDALGPVITAFAQFAAAVLPSVLGLLEQLFDSLAPVGDVFGVLAAALAPVITQLAGALQPVIAKLAGALVDLAPKITPVAQLIGSVLVQAVTSLAPVLPTLIDAGVALAGSFVDLVGALLPVLPPIVQLIGLGVQLYTMMQGSLLQIFAGFITFLANIAAPVLAAMAPYIQEFATWLQDHLQPAMQQLQPVIDLVVTFLAQMGTTIGRAVIPAMVLLVETALTVFGAILRGAATAFGWVPGLGPKLQGASAAFTVFSAQAKVALDGVKAAANINVNVNTAAALQHVQDVKTAIGTLVTMAAGAARTAAAAKIDIGVSGRGVAGQALGGPVTAKTAYLVGEQGPEIFTPEENGRVIPSSLTRQIVNRGTDGASAQPLGGSQRVVNQTNHINAGWSAREATRFLELQLGPTVSA